MNALQAAATYEPGLVAQLGNANLALSSEIGLAETIQNTLAPSVVYTDSRTEAYGQTIPRDEVGGDLLDLVANDQQVTTYVADVSGHGFRAGVLMGMVKTAVRYGLLLGQALPALLDAVNRVLPAVKESTMYATLAALRFDGSDEVEYVTAGHLPLLHFRRRYGDVVRRSVAQFPLGLFDAAYRSARIHFEPGDVFALVTDGIVETADGQESEFGLERLEGILCNLAGRPLSEIFEAAFAAVKRHGAQEDDRTLLLVRALPGENNAHLDSVTAAVV